METFLKEKLNTNEEILHLKLTRSQLENFQKGVNFLLASTKDKEAPIEIKFKDSDDYIIIERI